MLKAHGGTLPTPGPRGGARVRPGAQGLLALHLARGLVQGVPQDGVLLLQAGQLRVGAILQLLLERPDLKGHPRGIRGRSA